MKKLAIILAAVALIAGFGVMQAEAALTAGISVTVTVQVLSLSVVDGTIAFTTVAPGSNTVAAEKQVVTNDGNVSETYTIRLTTIDVYTVGETETAAGVNTFVLQALFTGSAGAAPLSANFGADLPADDDVVKASASQTASTTVYAWTGSTANGASVAPSAVRDLYLKYSAPTSVTTGLEENLTVTLTATAA